MKEIARLVDFSIGLMVVAMLDYMEIKPILIAFTIAWWVANFHARALRP
jgi:hypothetical protein